MASLLAFDAYATDWLNLLTRWLHVIAGIAWIGSSFYFIALDNHLRPPKDSARRRRRYRRRDLGDPRRRVLQHQEVPGRAARPAGDAVLVQVGGVHDLAQRFRADDRPLLPERRHVSDRQERRRPVRRRGGGDQRRPAGRGLGRVRRALPSACSQTARPALSSCWCSSPSRRGASAICSARARCISRSARCSGR